MSATIMSSAPESNSKPPTTAKLPHLLDIESVKCACCGLTEECTIAYIERIRERYQGKWICGLCAEAIKDEASRCEQMRISSDQALSRHLSFCNTFKSTMSPPPDPTIHMITALRQIVRRSLESPRLRSVPSSPTRNSDGGMKRKVLTRCESCIPTLTLVVDDDGDDHAEIA